MLSVCFCSACSSALLCIWCQSVFGAEDLLHSALKQDSFLERTLLCWTYFLLSSPNSIISAICYDLRPVSQSGISGQQANFGLNPRCFSQRLLKFTPSAAAMAAKAAQQTSNNCFLSDHWVNKHKHFQ